MVERQWVAALERRDAAGLECILAPEFTDIATNGARRDRRRVIADLMHRPNYRAHLEELESVAIGSTGIVRGLNRVTDSQGHLLAKVRFTDVFRYEDGRWKALDAQETLVK
jgi:Domain of unknown function (DUF4440)